MLDLPFREVWALDFEFVSESGALPIPVCLVAREIISNRLVRLWLHGESNVEMPFAADEDVLFVAFFASAEMSCFLELGWPIPARIVDLYTEFRNTTNGFTLPEGRGLLGALSHFGIASITSAEKHEERDLIRRGPLWTPEEQRRILDYCQTDVDPMGALLERLLPHIRASGDVGLGQALMRGRYMAAVARMERTGIPVDVELLGELRRQWDTLKLDLVREMDHLEVYEGTSFKSGKFAAWVAGKGIAWPKTDAGYLKTDNDTLRDMSQLYPELGPLKELKHALSELKLESIAVGPDGRNRALLSPFGARTGRNTPSNSKFMFGPAAWLRNIIRPETGRSLAYLDWKSQEVWIAAQLSGDKALLEAVQSGDPYLRFAILAGFAPPGATKETHKEVRNTCKTCVLGTNYGMEAESLAYRTGVSVLEARHILRALAATFPTYTEWADNEVNIAQLRGWMSTVFGWTVHITENTRPRALRNYPMQANGAEMLRIACCEATEAGIEVCAPVHDALLIEADTANIRSAVDTTKAAMTYASRVVLDGLEIGVDEELVHGPDNYVDSRGEEMWATLNRLLQ